MTLNDVMGQDLALLPDGLRERMTARMQGLQVVGLKKYQWAVLTGCLKGVIDLKPDMAGELTEIIAAIYEQLNVADAE